ncbi:hypothetical protein BDZ91DRAFT_739263, partial [Kalaharituber pfeilii]
MGFCFFFLFIVFVDFHCVIIVCNFDICYCHLCLFQDGYCWVFSFFCVCILGYDIFLWGSGKKRREGGELQIWAFGYL